MDSVCHIRRRRAVAEARTALERCVQIDPKIAEAYYQLGLLSRAGSDFPAAIQQFEHAIELQPKYFLALSALGTLYLQGGQLEKAEDVLRRAEAISASNAKTEYDLGQVLNKLGKRDEARERMDRFQKLRPAALRKPRE